MEWWQAIILGIAQGLTEFLPVSSSGHLVLLQELMGVTGSDDDLKAFDVAMHLATFLAVVWYFRTDLARMLGAWGRSVWRREVTTLDQRLSWLIFLGTWPAIFAFLFFGDALDSVEDDMVVVSSMLIGVSFLFFAADRVALPRAIAMMAVSIAAVTLVLGGDVPQSTWLILGTCAVLAVALLLVPAVQRRGDLVRGNEQLRWYHGLAIGTAQAVALVPGTSRSGSTIATGMLFGFDRKVAARFSFLLGTPAVFGAFLVKSPDLASAAGDTSFAVATVIGFIASLVAGVIAISALLRFLGSHSLSWFAAYRIPVAIFFLWWFVAK